MVTSQPVPSSESLHAVAQTLDDHTVERSITIGASAELLYRSWLEPSTLALVMSHFAQVSSIDSQHARWTVLRSSGGDLVFDTQVTDEREFVFVRWVSVDDEEISHEGSIEFRPAPRDWGTVVTLRMRFDPLIKPPKGALDPWVAGHTKDRTATQLLIGKTLRRFKSLIETGEVPVTSPQPAARNGGRDE